jgi:hypothetical protein
MEIGDEIWVNSAIGPILRVVARLDRGIDGQEIVSVCRREEFNQAKIEQREPNSIGFHATDVIRSRIPISVDEETVLKHKPR